MIESCSEFKKALYSYSFKDMPENERQSFLSHIDKCPECRSEFRNISELFADLNKITSPLHIPVPDKKSIHAGRRFNTHILYRGIAAAILSIILFLSVYIKNNGRKENQEISPHVSLFLYDISKVSEYEFYDNIECEIRLEDAKDLYYSQEDIYILLGTVEPDDIQKLNQKLKSNLLLRTAIGGVL
ncbi:zf-HC2 domain-containing protein [candidate division WOR-3 bacterium]|nr:zf-HC2 domain-containing protein [candidate division WOR-3 bacterium]